jgi:hypothetical protein
MVPYGSAALVNSKRTLRLARITKMHDPPGGLPRHQKGITIDETS